MGLYNSDNVSQCTVGIVGLYNSANESHCATSIVGLYNSANVSHCTASIVGLYNSVNVSQCPTSIVGLYDSVNVSLLIQANMVYVVVFFAFRTLGLPVAGTYSFVLKEKELVITQGDY